MAAPMPRPASVTSALAFARVSTDIALLRLIHAEAPLRNRLPCARHGALEAAGSQLAGFVSYLYDQPITWRESVCFQDDFSGRNEQPEPRRVASLVRLQPREHRDALRAGLERDPGGCGAARR